jgi:hypothetical protein
MHLRLTNIGLWSLLACASLTAACGPDDLFVSAALSKNASCKYEALEDNAILHGDYDIAPSAGALNRTTCSRPFTAHLLVRNSNDNDITVTSAEVRITTLAHETIRFDRAKAPLPNPFIATASGPLPGNLKSVAIVEAVPTLYGAQLGNFAKASVLAEIKLSAKSDGGDDVSANSFTLPIKLCEGCDTVCASQAAANANTDSCNDDDFCADPDC